MGQNKPRIIVAHPGKQHSFRLASALKKGQMLDCYCTTVYDKRDSFMMRTLKLLIHGINKKRAENRKNPDLKDDEVIQLCEFWGLVTIVVARMDKTKNRIIYKTINYFTSDLFGRKVAKIAIKRNVDAVVCYDTGALKCWEVLSKKAPQIRRIMDCSHMARPIEKELIEKEVIESGNTSLKNENLHLWNENNQIRYLKEIELTQYFLCPSHFVSQSLIQCGAEKKSCLIIPYGANISSDRILQEHEGKIKFIFVGGVSYAKGVHHLLRAFSKLDPERAELTLVGACNYKSDLYKEYCNKSNIRFKGWLLANQVKQQYENADIFILYSLREGMAQVGIEAMACGLPVIVSDRTGVNDLVEEGKNGFVIPYNDPEKLFQAMKWFIDNPSKIREMGIAAKATGSQYTWERYESEIQKRLLNSIRNNEKF